MGFDISTLFLGFTIFSLRIVDVSLGTLRVINVVQGRILISFFLGFCEVLIWLTVFGAIIHKVNGNPVLGVFYALGFATGSIVGIKIEQKMAFGNSVVRLFSTKKHIQIAEELRSSGFAVTSFIGEGLKGPIVELYILCKRKSQDTVVSIAEKIEPDIFYTIEKVTTTNRVYQSSIPHYSGWKSFVKRK